MFRRWICDISISMNPSPIAVKNVKYQKVPFRFVFLDVSLSGTTIHRNESPTIVPARVIRINIA